MFLTDIFLVRGRLPLSSFLCFIGGFSMGSWFTLFNQLQAEKGDSTWDLMQSTSIGRYPTNVLLTVLIPSSPTNGHLRDTIRNTWLKLKPSSDMVHHVFLVGTLGLNSQMKSSLEKESRSHQDLLLIPTLKDSYGNLTLKVQTGLNFINKNFSSQFVLKTDDDSFARLDLIAKELKFFGHHDQSDIKHSQDRCLYWGYFDGRAKVKKTGKWKEERPYILCDYYLPYALGGGYVISRKCVDFLVTNQDYLVGYSNEDVTIGTWLSPISPIYRHDSRFDTEWESRGCDNKHLVQHKITEADMKERFQNLQSGKPLCREVIQKRPSYEYDWNVPPSQCCRRH